MSLNSKIIISNSHESIHRKLDRYVNGNSIKDFFNTLIISTKSKIKPINPKLLILYIPAVILFIIVTLISSYYSIPIEKFTRDPLAITGGHPFLGIISNIGCILWGSSATICFLSYLLLKTRQESLDTLGFIMLGGFISLILLLDDLFMLHEEILPKYLGIGEKYLFLLYGALILFYLVRHRRIIIETEIIYFILAISFFAISILVDRRQESFLPMHYLFEDGAKFFGIVSWVGYHFSVCFREVQSTTNTLSPNKCINSN